MIDNTSDFSAAPAWDDGRAFEKHAAYYLSELWGVELEARSVPLRGGVTKKFDLVSYGGSTVGDAKYYKNISTPAAKWSTIAEYVWLLQHVESADRRFIVFGLDPEVSSRWLQRFRPLSEGVDFYFLNEDGLTTL